MKHSSDRILTIHAGSLPRPADLLDLLQSGGAKAFDQGGNAERLPNAVGEIVHKQSDLGIDVIDDGEFGKPSFVSCINERLGGYEVDKVAGPRNQWAVSRVLIPGVISHSTILVEHPELVAERLVRFASVVGRENVIAGSDCGFATFAGSKEVHPSIVWAKFKALSDGARIASKELWG